MKDLPNFSQWQSTPSSLISVNRPKDLNLHMNYQPTVGFNSWTSNFFLERTIRVVLTHHSLRNDFFSLIRPIQNHKTRNCAELSKSRLVKVLQTCSQEELWFTSSKATRVRVSEFLVVWGVENLATPNERTRSAERRSRPAAVPYIHKISHNLKRIASRYDIQVVLSAPDKLKRLCSKINRPQQTHSLCTVDYKHKYVNCDVNVVYEILCSCESVYLGQTGRCVNMWLREHALALQSSPSGHLAIHVRDFACTPVFNQTRVLKRNHNKRAREIYEAKTIMTKCISAPSVALSQKEQQYLDNFS